MTSVRARLGASVALALAATLVPAVVSSASAAPAPAAAARTASVAPALVFAPATSALPATVVRPTGRVVVTKAVLRNPVLRGRLIVLIAARYRGIPYRAGGTSPRTGFDCSGYTRYVFSQMGISIPRVSRAQYASMITISRSQAVPGDLVFFHSSSGRVYHAAIYAGRNTVWHSPHTGTRVQRAPIWTSAVYFARVRV